MILSGFFLNYILVLSATGWSRETSLALSLLQVQHTTGFSCTSGFDHPCYTSAWSLLVQLLQLLLPWSLLHCCRVYMGSTAMTASCKGFYWVSSGVLRRFSIGLSTGSQQGFQHWYSAGFFSTTVLCFLLLTGPGRRPWPFLCCKPSMLLAFLVPQGLIPPATQVPGVC